jgi:hypothetical protein
MPVYPGALQAQDLCFEQRLRRSAKIIGMGCSLTFLLVRRLLEAVANVSPARLCGNGLRETAEQQPRMRSPYETLGYSGISFVVNL